MPKFKTAEKRRNPFALPALWRPAKVLKDRRRVSSGAADWRRWLAEWHEEQEEAHDFSPM